MDTLAGTRGAYDPKTKTMYLPISKNKDTVLSTTLHELQRYSNRGRILEGLRPPNFCLKILTNWTKKFVNEKKFLKKRLITS